MLDRNFILKECDINGGKLLKNKLINEKTLQKEYMNKYNITHTV